MKKGVVSTISLVLIVLVVLALVAIAYVWGMPLIEKRTSTVNYASAENFMIRLDKAITDIVSAGGGQEEIKIPFGSVIVKPDGLEDPDNNSLIIEFVLPQPLAIDRSVIYIGSVSFSDVDRDTGVYGQSSPGVMTLTTSHIADEFLYRIKLHYRDLETFTAPIRGYKVAVRSSKPAGASSVVVSFGSTETLPGASPSGGDLTRTFVDINVY